MTTIVTFNPMLVPGLKHRKPLPDSISLRKKIGEITCSEFGIKYEEMFIRSRKRERVLSRQISMMLIKMNEPGVSFKNIGNHFGGMDHATVVHAVKTINNLMCYDQGLRERVNKIQEML